MVSNTSRKLRGLILSATELRQMHPSWPQAMIEDYLNIFNNIVTLSDLLDVEIKQKLEEISTDFTDGSIPFAESGFVTQDLRLNWQAINRIFTADGVHVSAGRRKAVRSVSNDYNLTIYDEELYVDTTGGTVSVYLPAGIDGTSYRIHNIGSVNNPVLVTPDGIDLLFGDNTVAALYDAEVFILTFESTNGWD